MSFSKKKRSAFAFFIVLLIPIGFYTFFEIKKHLTGIRIKELPVLSVDSIPEFNFVTHTGDSISKEKVKDKILIFNFFYTTCKGICPRMSSEMNHVQNFVRGHPNLKSKYQIISLTVDPETDDVKHLHDYAELYGVDSTIWVLATGNKDDIYALATGFFKLPTAQIMRDTLEPFVHSDRFILVDKAGYIRGYYDGTDTPSVKQMMKDIVMLDIDYEIREKKREKKEPDDGGFL